MAEITNKNYTLFIDELAKMTISQKLTIMLNFSNLNITGNYFLYVAVILILFWTASLIALTCKQYKLKKDNKKFLNKLKVDLIQYYNPFKDMSYYPWEEKNVIYGNDTINEENKIYHESKEYVDNLDKMVYKTNTWELRDENKVNLEEHRKIFYKPDDIKKKNFFNPDLFKGHKDPKKEIWSSQIIKKADKKDFFSQGEGVLKNESNSLTNNFVVNVNNANRQYNNKKLEIYDKELNKLKNNETVSHVGMPNFGKNDKKVESNEQRKAKIKQEFDENFDKYSENDKRTTERVELNQPKSNIKQPISNNRINLNLIDNYEMSVRSNNSYSSYNPNNNVNNVETNVIEVKPKQKQSKKIKNRKIKKQETVNKVNSFQKEYSEEELYDHSEHNSNKTRSINSYDYSTKAKDEYYDPKIYNIQKFNLDSDNINIKEEAKRAIKLIDHKIETLKKSLAGVSKKRDLVKEEEQQKLIEALEQKKKKLQEEAEMQKKVRAKLDAIEREKILAKKKEEEIKRQQEEKEYEDELKRYEEQKKQDLEMVKLADAQPVKDELPHAIQKLVDEESVDAKGNKPIVMKHFENYIMNYYGYYKHFKNSPLEEKYMRKRKRRLKQYFARNKLSNSSWLKYSCRHRCLFKNMFFQTSFIHPISSRAASSLTYFGFIFLINAALLFMFPKYVILIDSSYDDVKLKITDLLLIFAFSFASVIITDLIMYLVNFLFEYDRKTLYWLMHFVTENLNEELEENFKKLQDDNCMKLTMGWIIGVIFFFGGLGLGFLFCSGFKTHQVTYLIMVILGIIIDNVVFELFAELLILCFYLFKRKNHFAANTGVRLVNWRSRRVLFP